MRVISGSAKGIRLMSVPGKSTRPITDQVKEALFNILGADIYDRTLLDLFGGTGAVGIEALSRGAEHVTFLDINYRAYQVIKQNLALTNLEDYATVLKMDAFVFLREQPRECFDLVYIAPPQYKDLWNKALILLDENPEWVCDDGMVIVQIHPKEFDENYNYTKFIKFDTRDYGDTILVFYEKRLGETND
jgi:16S rRNA (guanine(966)-N(2))-methyltransferase RsmD